MKLLRRLFSRHPKINATTAKIDEMVYLMNYEKYYGDTFSGLGQDYLRQEVLAELFLFRGWSTQFGYRIFSSDMNVSEKLIGETVNSTKYLGLAVFQEIHGFSVEEVLGMDYISLIEDRWRIYDLIVATHTGESIPTMEIIAELTNVLGVTDPTITYQLTSDFLGQLEQIKRNAISLGMLR